MVFLSWTVFWSLIYFEDERVVRGRVVTVEVV